MKLICSFYNLIKGSVLLASSDNNKRMLIEKMKNVNKDSLIVIAGVGDLYTDPQIHTSDGKGYGDANLGPRGMALFFSSHKCNR